MELEDKIWDSYASVIREEQDQKNIHKFDRYDKRYEQPDPLDFSDLECALRDNFIDKLERKMSRVPKQVYAILGVIWIALIAPVSYVGVDFLKNKIFLYNVSERNLFFLVGIAYYLFSFILIYMGIRHFTREERIITSPETTNSEIDEQSPKSPDVEHPFEKVYNSKTNETTAIEFIITRRTAWRIAACLVAILGFGVTPLVNREVIYEDGFYQATSISMADSKKVPDLSFSKEFQFFDAEIINEYGIEQFKKGYSGIGQLSFLMASKGSTHSVSAEANMKNNIVGANNKKSRQVSEDGLTIAKEREEELEKVRYSLKNKDFITDVVTTGIDVNTLAVGLADAYPRISGSLYEKALDEEVFTSIMNTNLGVLGTRILNNQVEYYADDVNGEIRLINPNILSQARVMIDETPFPDLLDGLKNTSNLELINGLAVSYEEKEHLFEAALLYSMGYHKNYLDMNSALLENYKRFKEKLEGLAVVNECVEKQPFRSIYLFRCSSNGSDPAVEDILAGNVLSGFKEYSKVMVSDDDNYVALLNYTNLLTEVNIYKSDFWQQEKSGRNIEIGMKKSN